MIDVNDILLRILSKRMGAIATNCELKAKLKLKSIPKLSIEEEKEIKYLWQSLSSSINFGYWRLYKSLGFYSPRLIPDDIFASKVIRVLNPMMDANVFHKKYLYDIIFNGLNQPKVIAKCINGQLYIEGKIFTKNPIEFYKTLNGKFIFKPSVNSCGGSGIEIYNFDDINSRTADSLSSLLKRMGSDYVCQELVFQCDETSVFNPSSLNTFRINTLNLNGVTSVTNIMFRHGRGKVIVDNAGAGGVCCGLDNDGTFINDGIDANLNIYNNTASGIKYKEHRIESVKKIVQYAIDAHQQYLPTIAHVAWDFALDQNKDPVMIEVNLGWPGIITEQLSSRRPIYNERVDEVIDYCISNSHKLDWRDFIGRWI